MYIAIKSEMDSRPFVYPLMRALMNLGSILVVSSNRQLLRLIRDSEDGETFRNITIKVNEDGATDDVMYGNGFAANDFDFVILDNVGVLDYDMQVYLLGSGEDPTYQDEIQMILESDEASKLRIVQFGKAPGGNDKKQTKKEPKPKRGKAANAVADTAEEVSKSQEMNNAEIIKARKAQTVSVPFPTYQEIESVEGEHKFYKVNESLITLFYDILKDAISMELMQFRKEVLKPDESSGYIKR